MTAPALGHTLAALDALPGDLAAFVRDDDGGWADARLMRLLDVCAHSGTPIDLALIPQAMDDRLFAELCRRIDHEGAAIGLHQHGFSHANHEAEGRKCEFGPTRALADQRADLTRGFERLRSALAHRLDPIFTPPWNRCTPATAALLAELGYQALSREHRASPLPAIPSLDVHLDWSRVSREGGASGLDQALAQAITRCGLGGQPFGLMLHHGAMSEAEFDWLAHWLGQLSQHPRLHWHRMRAWLRPTATRAATPLPGTTALSFQENTP